LHYLTTARWKKGRLSEAQLMAILQQQASGQAVVQIVREHGLRVTLGSKKGA
jgi:hypothetical protein